MRPIEPDGEWGAKSKKEYILDEKGKKVVLKSGEYKSRKINTTDWNDRNKAEEWRKAWADVANSYLEQIDMPNAQRQLQIDHRSYLRQGTNKIPTVHLGVAASQMEQKGITTDRGSINREVESANRKLAELGRNIAKLRRARIAEKKSKSEATVVTLADTIQKVLEEKNKPKQKNISKMLEFLKDRKITDLKGLQAVISDIRKEFSKTQEDLRAVDLRIKELKESIRQADRYREHKEVYKEYQRQKPGNKKEQFYEMHHQQITFYEAAGKYLGQCLDENGKVPYLPWQQELEELTAKRQGLQQKYNLLQKQTTETEEFGRLAGDILGEAQTAQATQTKQKSKSTLSTPTRPAKKKKRSRDMEL